MGWERWMADQRATREAAGLQRTLHPRGAHEPTLDLASNDYLGLGTHPAVREASAAAAIEWGAGATSSRLVTGSTELHQRLERALADFLGREAALVLSTGYHANLSVVTALADRHTLVVSDAHVHASLIDAVRLSRADVTVVPHNDVDAVCRALATRGDRRALVLTESVFSVLGDAAPLPELAEVCEETEALLVVDEAHGLGVVGPGGRGLVAGHGLSEHPSVVVTLTLSKALGAMGGAVVGSPVLVDHLVNRARPFIFDTGLAPAPTAGALAALDLLRDDPSRPDEIHERASVLAARLGVEAPAGAVLSVPMPSPAAALAAQAQALSAGVRVACFRPPSVPDGISRLRVTTRAGLGDESWEMALGVLAEAVGAHR